MPLMKILVTGGTGAVGKYIVDDLVQHGYQVGVLDLTAPARSDVVQLYALGREGEQLLVFGLREEAHRAAVAACVSDRPCRYWARLLPG